MDISNELYPHDNLHDTDGDADELLSLPVSQDTKDLYLKNLALSYLRLQSKYLLPAATIQHIMEELQDVHCRSIFSSASTYPLKGTQSRNCSCCPPRGASM